MRIGIIVHQFLPKYYAGTEQLTFKTSRDLNRRGHAAFIIAGDPEFEHKHAPSIEREIVEGQTVFRLRGIRRDHNWLTRDTNNTATEPLIRSVLEETRPDILHVHHFSMIGAGILKVASDKNIPVIFTPTDFWWFCPQGRLQLPDDSVCAGPSGVGGNCLRHFTSIAIGRRSKIAGDLLYKVPATFWNTLTIVSKTPLVNILPFGNNASALASRPSELDHLKCHIHRILAPTELIQSAMLRVGFAPEIIHLLPYGVDPIERTNKSSDTITVGFIGSISPHKGAHVLLEALSQLPPHIHFKTTIYGDTTYNSKYSAHLHALADASGKDVEFRGKFNEREIGQVLSDLDILVIPSTWAENRPLTLLAALDARVPIIVSDMPGMTCEVTDGENGMVVPAGDPVALAGSLMRLLEDTNLRERLSNSSLRPIRFDKYIDVLEREYRSLCRDAHSNSAFNDWGGASDKGWNTIVESQSAANYRFR